MTFFRRQPWPFFNEFLVTTLNGAESFTKVNGVCSISEDLEFNVLCSLDVLLNKHTVVTKGGFCTRLTELQCAFKLAFFFDDLHTDSATTSSGFDDDRVTDIIGKCGCNGRLRNGFRGTFRSWQTCGFHGCSRLDFIAKERDHICAWADERNSFFLEPFHKTRIFCEKTEAWVNRQETKVNRV